MRVNIQFSSAYNVVGDRDIIYMRLRAKIGKKLYSFPVALPKWLSGIIYRLIGGDK